MLLTRRSQCYNRSSFRAAQPVELCWAAPRPVLQYVCAGQVAWLAAGSWNKADKGNGNLANPQPRRPCPAGVGPTRAAWDPHGGLSSGVGPSIPRLPGKHCRAAAQSPEAGGVAGAKDHPAPAPPLVRGDRGLGGRSACTSASLWYWASFQLMLRAAAMAAAMAEPVSKQGRVAVNCPAA